MKEGGYNLNSKYSSNWYGIYLIYIKNLCYPICKILVLNNV